MKNKLLKLWFEYIRPTLKYIIVPGLICAIIVYLLSLISMELIYRHRAKQFKEATFEQASIMVDSSYERGYQLGKVAMTIGIVRVVDSIGLKRPKPWNLHRASEIADSIKNSK